MIPDNGSNRDNYDNFETIFPAINIARVNKDPTRSVQTILIMHIERTSQQVLIILILRNVPVDIRLQAKVKPTVKTLVVLYKYVKMSCVNNNLNS